MPFGKVDPDSRPRRRVLRVRAAVPAVAAVVGAAAARPGRRRRRRRLLECRTARPGVQRGRSSSSPRRSAISPRSAALWLVVLAFGAWLAIPGPPDDGVIADPRRDLRGCPCPDAGAARAQHRGRARRAARGLPGVPRTAVADRHGLRAVCGRVARRRPGYAAALQRFVVAPNEQVKETPYIVHNVAATRDAFALDQRGRA